LDHALDRALVAFGAAAAGGVGDDIDLKPGCKRFGTSAFCM
jgi:hypothetical protein